MPRDSERLVTLALCLDASSSRVEDIFWERELDTLLTRQLRTGNDTAVDAALDHLITVGGGVYGIFADQCESVAESQVATHDGVEHDLLLVGAPILAWTRYAIPSGPLRPADAEVLRVHLGAHVLAADARFFLAPWLFSLEQIPQTLAATFALNRRLGNAALAGSVPRLNLDDAPETAPLLADSRFLIAGIAVPRGKAVFRWQETPESGDPMTRAQCLDHWSTQVRPNIAPLLPSCGFDLLLPDAFYASLHTSDRRIRPYSIKASAAHLDDAMKLEPSRVRAVIAGVGEKGIDEYRIGFSAKDDDTVLHGVVWPLYGDEDIAPDDETGLDAPQIEDIGAVLKEAGITDMHVLPGMHLPEFCDDCGAPLYPDANGDFVHAEAPESAGKPSHFH